MDLKVELPKNAISEVIYASLADSLEANGVNVAKELVKEILSKKNRGYDKKSIFENTVDRMLMDVANEAAREYIDEFRPKLKAALRAQLEARKGAEMDELAGKMSASLMQAWSRDVLVEIRKSVVDY